MEKQDIKSMTQEELRAFLVSLGEKPFRTAQIYQWMHEKLASSFDDPFPRHKYDLFQSKAVPGCPPRARYVPYGIRHPSSHPE